MRYLTILFLFFWGSLDLQAQQSSEKRKYIVERQRVFDNEKIFKEHEIRTFEKTIADGWTKGIVDIAIITVNDKETNRDNFDQYVRDKLLAYAPGMPDKNNGIVIVISKSLRKMRIQNGYGPGYVLSHDLAKKLIEEDFIPQFKQGNYFEGTSNGVKSVIRAVEKVMRELDFENVSSIFSPDMFKKIREFVQSNGDSKSLRDTVGSFLSYRFALADIFLGPAKKNAFVSKANGEKDYYEMIIRDHKGGQYQFVYFDRGVQGDRLKHKSMRDESVYWWHSAGKFISHDVWPILDQIEDEMLQKTATAGSKQFNAYRWVLRQEFNAHEKSDIDTEENPMIAFEGNNLLMDGKVAGTFKKDSNKQILTLNLGTEHIPAFAIYPIEGNYYYRYIFNMEKRKLYLIPLDENKENEMINIEGNTLLFEMTQ